MGGGPGRLATRLSNGPLTRHPRVGGRVGEGALEGSLLAFQTGLLLASPASGEGWEGALEGSLATRLSKRASYSRLVRLR